jgi:polyribonucleotide nucleotidyltransferase
MGLIKEGDEFAVLSDILGDEDHLGDMDFKVAGTENGITALQMDIKIDRHHRGDHADRAWPGQGRPPAHPRRDGQALSESRGQLGEFAPRIEVMNIPVDKIRDVIGTGGKVIREIVEKTGAKINIDDDGTIKIASSSGKEIEAAKKWIHSIVAEPEVGVIYEGTVVKVADFGAFVNFFGPRTAWSTSRSWRRTRRQDLRRRQGRRQGLGQAARLRRARQGPPVDEGRRPGNRQGNQSEPIMSGVEARLGADRDLMLCVGGGCVCFGPNHTSANEERTGFWPKKQ